jgi:hypothetical protein
MAFYLSILLYVALSPLIFLYGLLLCPIVWIEWAKEGKDMLFIDKDGKYSREWIARILPMVGERAMFLNYSQHDRWERWSLVVQIFEIFGPHGMPERFTQYSLPAVILFRNLRLPRKFTFGEHCEDRETKLEQLRSELAID